MKRTRWPASLLALTVALAVGTFVVLPIGAILVESLAVRGPMPVDRLVAMTASALDILPSDRRTANLERWWASADSGQRLATMIATFERHGVAATWDKTRTFEEQSRAAARRLAEEPAERRRAIEADFPMVNAALHRRVALAFQVRDQVGPAEFERLRGGIDERYGLDHYMSFWRDPHLRHAFWNSLSIAFGAATLSTTLAFALAYAVNRGGVRSPHLARAIVLLPLVSPPAMIASAIVMLFGRSGLVTKTVFDDGLGLIDADETNIYGMAGVVLAQILAFVPAAFIVNDNVLAKHDGRIEEAAAGQGARRWQIFLHVTLPLASPGLRRALILTFMLSLTDFGNPLILGRDAPVVAAIIYDEITAFRNTPLAAALCVWLLVPCLLVFLVLERSGRRARYDSGTDATPPEMPLPHGWRVALSALTWLTCAAIVIIYATVAAGSVTKVWGVDWTVTFGYFTMEGVNTGHQGSGYGSSDRGIGLVWQSMEIAGIAALIGGPLAAVIGYVVERLRPLGGETIAFAVMLPAVLPGIVFGVGYIVAFNNPLGVKELALTGTKTILVLNIMFGNLFVGVLAARGALQRIDTAIEEAAESLGANLGQRLILVVAPMLIRALLLGSLFVFVDGMTTLSSVIFLVSGEYKLASVAIFNHANGGEYGYAAAKSVAIMAFALVAMAVIRRYERPGLGSASRAPATMS